MMRPDEVPEGLVEQAERTLAFGICDDNRLDGKCDCPTDEQIRIIIAAVLPEIQAQALREFAASLPSDWKRPNTTDQIRKEHHL